MLRNTMKKVINRISLVLLAIGFLISCDSDLTNTNINPNGVSPETANATLVVPNVIHSFTREYSNLGQRNAAGVAQHIDRKSTRLNSSHVAISYAVFCLTKNQRN